MFTIFIDDSGSSPEHKWAVATGIVIPAMQLPRLEREWDTFKGKEGISEFHSSECLARNQHSDFADWEDIRVRRVFTRVRQITFKYSVKAFGIGIYKPDYDQVMPEDMRKRIGSYYTWALSSVLALAHDWAARRSVPMEYVFDEASKNIKREINEAMQYSDQIYPGDFVGHYSFRYRKDIPALQAVDLFAWTCYQQGRKARLKLPIHHFAQENWDAYGSQNDGEWCVFQSLNREGIEDWIKKAYLGPEDLKIKEFKDKLKEERKPKPKKSKLGTARSPI
ncbi:MAG TPA: DUF3800 domain-containing protein [Acidobacteriaceae bacterium]|nr:DUF3800 domain-containing protein [Acidobacteriaceae bacterium]